MSFITHSDMSGLSFANDAIVKIAVLICNQHEFKHDIFSGRYSHSQKLSESKKSWDESIEKRVQIVLKDMNLDENQLEAVIGAVFSVSRRMLIWVEYYKGTFGFTRNFCIEFLKSSLFTPLGMIKSEELKDEMFKQTLSNLQRFQLASFYCQKSRIPNAYKNLTDEEKKEVYNESVPELISQPDIVKYWSYYYKSELDKLQTDLKIKEFRLGASITSGSQVAVECCLFGTANSETKDKNEETKDKNKETKDKNEETKDKSEETKDKSEETKDKSEETKDKNEETKDKNERMIGATFTDAFKRHQNRVIDVVTDLIKYRMLREKKANAPRSDFENDWVVFRKPKYDIKRDNWTPNCFLTDIFYLLLSSMSEAQRSELMDKLFFEIQYESESFKLKNSTHLKCLELFLCWPYQDKFLELLKLSWEKLPNSAYGSIILEILNRIEPKKGEFWYGEDKICDYKKLLMEVWLSSPPKFKRYIFRDKKLQSRDQETNQIFNEGKELLYKICNRNNFTEDDRKDVMSVFKFASLNQRINFLQSSAGTQSCIRLIEKGKLDLFEELIALSFKSSERARKFRLEFSGYKSKDEFLECVKNEKWDEAEGLLNWGEPTDEERAKIKEDIILCKDAMRMCRELCLTQPNIAERFVVNCLLSDDAITNFKRSLLYTDEGITMSVNFLQNDDTHSINQLVNWCLPSSKDLNDFKQTLAIRKTEISFNSDSNFDNIENANYVEFQNCIDWESSEYLFSWCFSTEPQLNSFKRMFLRKSKAMIIRKCIELNKWSLADKYVSWLRLPTAEEEKILKKKLFFEFPLIKELFDDYMSKEEDDSMFTSYGGQHSVIECFLKWFLVDKGSIDEFLNIFRCYTSEGFIQDITNELSQKYPK